MRRVGAPQTQQAIDLTLGKGNDVGARSVIWGRRETPKFRAELDTVTGRFERRHDLACHQAIARGHGMIGRFQRRIKGNLHISTRPLTFI
jgi:hypothetical protein